MPVLRSACQPSSQELEHVGVSPDSLLRRAGRRLPASRNVPSSLQCRRFSTAHYARIAWPSGAEHVSDERAGLDDSGRKVEQLEKLAAAHDRPPFPVHHAPSLRHGVELGIEARSQSRDACRCVSQGQA